MSLFQEIELQAQQATDPQSLHSLIDQLSTLIAQSDEPVNMLRLRAAIWVKLDEKGKAINDYREMLVLDPEDEEAATQIQYLQTILRYNNTDIYANPNTNMDPWLE
ncbi:MAG: hypothetical protein CVT99_10160 [Bacteroidetes bacterium HGW-Bacteroidetes-16]|jgi:predicted TPR repeat methyltransferase|nr:MAG: hypothetical protein CVT99_10160 [Bacteroidetes bacterium HGW-Bacteroidetes-16]